MLGCLRMPTLEGSSEMIKSQFQVLLKISGKICDRNMNKRKKKDETLILVRDGTTPRARGRLGLAGGLAWSLGWMVRTGTHVSCSWCSEVPHISLTGNGASTQTSTCLIPL
jgi:hypothetical protein